MSIPTQSTTTALPGNLIPEIEALLHSYCRNKIEDSKIIGQGVTQLWQEIDEYISGGGKRLRPRIFMMMYQFYGGTDTETVVRAACAWELLHASVLIHDDIIDRDTIRHGKLNIAGKYQQKYAELSTPETNHYALSAALIAGDLLLSSAYDIVNSSNLTDAQKIIMHDCIQRAIFVVGGGELMDTESALYPIDSVNPFAIATHKTASYSFEFPMVSGATLAGASDQDIQAIRDISKHAGIAFQLKDDLLGIFGDSQTTGKSNRSDIVEKKRTLLVQYALRSTPAVSTKRLRMLYEKKEALTAQEADEVFGIIENTSAKHEVEALVERHTESALESIANLAIKGADKDTLVKLITNLMKRQS